MTRNAHISLHLANSLQDDAPIRISPETLFGRHCAVVGSSGAGKSWSVARLVGEASQFRSKILLIDATGEYENLTHNTFHLHLGAATRKGVPSRPITLPFFELTEADLMAIFEPSSSVQWIKLRAAIRTLKLLQAAPELGSGGTFTKANKLKTAFEAELLNRRGIIERPQALFNVNRLPLQIDLECVEPVRSQTEHDYWGGLCKSDHQECIPLINRIEEMLRTPELQGIFNPPEGASAFRALDKFLTDPSISVLRISLEFLPSSGRVREIAANAMARHLVTMGRNGLLRGTPLVAILDEAHQVLRPLVGAHAHEVPMDAFSCIAKEGRKYGLTLCIATQRPRDIPEDILSQMGMFLVHRLIGMSDRKAIENASGTMDEATFTTLATLGPGEAFLLGAGLRDPIALRMMPPTEKPLSDGPDYQSAWIGRNGKQVNA